MHRDIKEGNFLITKQARCVVCDLGMAAAEQDDIRKFIVCGTGAYVAPECYIYSGTERWNNLTKQCDILSIGMLLQNIFTPGGIKAHPALEGITSQDELKEWLRQFDDPACAKAYEARYKELENRDSVEHLIWSCTRSDTKMRPRIDEVESRFHALFP